MVAPSDDADPIASFFRSLREREFPMLDERGLAYLDYTGAALPSASQIAAHDELLRSAIFGNPHSEHGPSRQSTETIERARALTLEFFDADPGEYAVCFTANASAAIKLVAESYPFAPGSTLALSADNHNSVNGVREFARRAGAAVVTVPLTADLRLDDPVAALTTAPRRTPSLFALPAQSNFSGVLHPLSLIEDARNLGYSVLLDAAAYVPSHSLSLRAMPADFIALSFYKMFGLPTGVGALIARRDALAMLQRPWFAGGTVDWVSVQHGERRLRGDVGAFEDGTPNYFGVGALESGLAFLRRVGMPRLCAHAATRTGELLDALTETTHRDGAPMFQVYGPASAAGRGATVAFNVLDRTGRVVPYEAVEACGRRAGVAMRGGCFCNPGAAESAFAFPAAESLRCLREASARGFTPRRFAECIGGDVAVGALRASAGAATSAADLRRAVDVCAGIADAT